MLVRDEQVEVAPRTVGLFGLSRAIATYDEDDIVASKGTR